MNVIDMAMAMAMSKPKKIYLSEYSGYQQNGSLSFTLEGAILFLMGNGGGSMTLTGENIAKFWKDIATDRTVQAVMHLSENIISSQAVSICTYKGEAIQLAASVSMYNNDMGGLVTMSCVIDRYSVSGGTTIIVKLA